MELNELTRFFGLPAQSKEFDHYLSARDFAERPTFTESPVERINWKEGGVSLVFESRNIYQKWYAEPREDGDMIFASLQAYGAVNDSGFSPFQGQLPYNLTFATTLAEARAIFGEPTTDHVSGPNWVYVWYGHHGNTISLCFLPDDKGVSFFGLKKDKRKLPVKSVASVPSPEFRQ